jgi:RNA polymerase sigma-70 factor (ECF subfamily)
MDNKEASGVQIRKLVERCKKNDRRAQLVLYNYFVKDMYSTCFRIVKDSVMAEDIVQESFISAFRSIRRFSNEVPFSAWIRRIVINQSITTLRRNKHHKLFELDEEKIGAEITEEVNAKEEEVELTRQLAEIRLALLELPDGFRTIFSLYYIEGYDHDEIAEIMGIRASTSRSQLTRAKQKLIEKLKQKT